MERIVCPYRRVFERLAPLVDDAQLPVAVPVPDLDEHFVVRVFGVGVDVFLVGELDQYVRGNVGDVVHRERYVVQVVAAELVLLGPAGGFVEPCEIGSVYIPDRVAARGAVDADVDAGSQVARPPPRCADRAGVVFVDIASLHHVVVGGDVVDLVRVSRHEMDFVAVQRREQRLGLAESWSKAKPVLVGLYICACMATIRGVDLSTYARSLASHFNCSLESFLT